MKRRLGLLAALSLGLATLACDSGSSAAPALTPTAQATATSTAAAGRGSAQASINALCQLTKVGAQLNVSYKATAQGGATISRVRIQLDGSVVKDTGEMATPEYEGIATLYVAPGTNHSVAIVANAPGLPAVTSRYALRCPEAPDPNRF